MSFESSGNTIGITVSVAIAGCGESVDTFDALLKRADTAVYNAKSAGRDCVFV